MPTSTWCSVPSTGGPAVTAYHELSAAEHQRRIDELTAAGWHPKNVAVVSVNGARSYAALYERSNIGSYVVRSALTPAQYQEESEANRRAGRQLAYLTAYEHNGQPHFSAIWNSATTGSFKARHGLTGSQYQQEWEETTRRRRSDDGPGASWRCVDRSRSPAKGSRGCDAAS